MYPAPLVSSKSLRTERDEWEGGSWSVLFSPAASWWIDGRGRAASSLSVLFLPTMATSMRGAKSGIEQRCGGEGEWASSAKRAREAGKSGERVGLWSEMQQRLSEGQRWRVKRADTVLISGIGKVYGRQGRDVLFRKSTLLLCLLTKH